MRAQIRNIPLLVGVRHILDVEDQDWLLREDVHRGLRVLEEEDKVFDCLVRPPTLKHVATIGENRMTIYYSITENIAIFFPMDAKENNVCVDYRINK